MYEIGIQEQDQIHNLSYNSQYERLTRWFFSRQTNIASYFTNELL